MFVSIMEAADLDLGALNVLQLRVRQSHCPPLVEDNFSPCFSHSEVDTSIRGSSSLSLSLLTIRRN